MPRARTHLVEARPPRADGPGRQRHACRGQGRGGQRRFRQPPAGHVIALERWLEITAELDADVDPSARRADLMVSGVDLERSRGPAAEDRGLPAPHRRRGQAVRTHGRGLPRSARGDGAATGAAGRGREVLRGGDDRRRRPGVVARELFESDETDASHSSSRADGSCMGGVALAVAASPPRPAEAAPDEGGGIREVVRATSAARERGDAAALAALFTDDADQLISSGEWRRGRDALVPGTLASSKSQQPGPGQSPSRR